jgi:FMNH2-dependent dimethyl sulfone monooxygenase
MKPKPEGGTPQVFQGGSSRAARDMPARVSDWYFTNGNTPEGLNSQVDDIRGKEKAFGKAWKTRIVMNAFGIIRATEKEVQEVLKEIIDKAIPDAVNGFRREVQNAGNASPEREGNLAKSTFQDLVQYNDGFRSNLIGTPERVAERIIGHKRAVRT